MSLQKTAAKWTRKATRRLRNRGLSSYDAFLRDQRRDGTWAFIHINKCGGASVEKAFDLPRIHDTARQRRDRLGADRWAALATFSIVRDPYAKVVSHYKYRIKTNQTDLAARDIDLSDWVCRAYGDRDPAYYDKPLMFAPCLDWIADEDGRIIVDYVARLETIDADWPKIQTLIGQDVALPKTNRTDHTNRLGPADLNDAARAVIAARFAPDFDQFGYAR